MALNTLTGTFTNPKLIDPDQIALTILVIYPVPNSRPSGSHPIRTPLLTCRTRRPGPAPSLCTNGPQVCGLSIIQEVDNRPLDHLASLVRHVGFAEFPQVRGYRLTTLEAVQHLRVQVRTRADRRRIAKVTNNPFHYQVGGSFSGRGCATRELYLTRQL
jgi:hypothetical protein